MSDQIVIVGPGRMGLALGAALLRAEAVDRLTFYGRSFDPPPHPLFEGGWEPAVGESEGSWGADYRTGPAPLLPGTTILILAVPDAALGDVAYDMSVAGPAPPGCVALHLSGALSTDVLAPLHLKGYAVGSLHPLQAVADPWHGGEHLVGSAFALAGEPAALVAGRRLVAGLGGFPLVIPPVFRSLYHAAAVMASNYVVALTAAAARMLGEAGVGEAEALRALLPLLRGTLDNIEKLGIRAALTGPIARGDVDTVRLHLARLSPRDRSLYCGLGVELLELARGAGLDERRAQEIETLLRSS